MLCVSFGMELSGVALWPFKPHWEGCVRRCWPFKPCEAVKVSHWPDGAGGGEGMGAIEKTVVMLSHTALGPPATLLHSASSC